MPSRKNAAIVPHKLSAKQKAILRMIRLVVLDVDGVMTDGRMVYGSDGTQYKFFDVYDGFGITRAIDKGLMIAIISRGYSEATALRGKRLGITAIHQNVRDKRAAYEQLAAELGVTAKESCFIGDDVYDMELLETVAFSAAPSTAYPPVKKCVDFVTSMPGGRGAVREVLDMILDSQGLL